MESYRKSIAKKICIYLLCTCLISTSVFMSYENTMSVYADDYDNLDMVQYWIFVAATIGGIASIPFTGGITLLGGLASAGGVLGVISGYDDYKNYVLDIGDGTYTITPEFIQIVLDEAKRQEESYFSDYVSIQNADGTYNIIGYYIQDDGPQYGVSSYIYSGTSSYRPFATLSKNTITQGVWINQYISRNNFNIVNVPYKYYLDGVYKSSGTSSTIGSNYAKSAGVNIPVFPSANDALAAFESGDFTGALNYREKMFEYGSIYAPVYNGGSVTFRKEVLDRFEDKLKEIDEKYDNVDDKINALYEYITNDGSGGSGGNNDSGGSDNSGGSSGSGNNNYDGYFNDILDYLKKIYSSLQEVLEEIKGFDLSDWLKDITFYLKDISGQLKDFNDAAESMERLNSSLQELSDRIGDDTYGQEIEGLLQSILDELRNQEGQDLDSVVDSMESIDDKLQELLDLIGDNMSKDDIEDILQQILDALNNDGVADSMESIDDKLQELVDSINDNMSKDDIEDILKQILEEMRYQEGQDLDGVIDGMESIEDKLQELLDSINDGMSKDDIGDILQQILEEMRNQEGQDLEGVTDRLDSLEETLNEILKELKNSGDDDGLFGDLINLLAKILDDPETGSQEMVDALSSSFGELASGLTKKFPFSIPWDIQYMLLCLAETPRAPSFELPIVLERYGINEKIIIEMEMFETLSELSRSLFSILFGIFLVNLTFKVIEMKKEE